MVELNKTEGQQKANPVRRIFTATLVMGVSGSGKTSLLKTFAEYLWETYGRILLLYSWDGGAIPTLVQQRVKQGLIRYWRVQTRSEEGLAIETLYLATKGYWPRTIDPLTGQTDPAVGLVPPVTTKYETFCANGHSLQVVPAPSLIVPTYCSICKRLPSPGEIRSIATAKPTKGFELVGGVAFDSISSMSVGVLDEMDRQRGAGLIGGEKPAFGGVVQSGSIKLGGNNRADIGFAQTRAQQFVRNSLSIPNLVEGPVFTGLTLEATDEGGLSVVGCKLPGRAATDEASAWFGNVMETAKEKDDHGKDHFTIYLKPFTDPQGRRHLLKTSGSPGAIPDKLIDPPEDSNQPNTIANLGRVYKMLDDDLRRLLTVDAEGTPGAQDGMQTYGEPFAVESAQKSTAVAAPPAAGGMNGTAPAITPPPAQSAGAPASVAPRQRRSAPTAPPVIAVEQPPITDSPASTAAPPPPGARPPQRAPGT